MTFWLLSVLLVLGIWAVCSLLETSIYSVRQTYVRHLAESGSRAGQILAGLKKNIEQPVSAILVINTAVSAGGAAVVGAQARELLGETSLITFSIVFSISALVLSEIIPKLLGVRYNQTIARVAALPLQIAVNLLRPVTWVMHWIAVGLRVKDSPVVAPEEEVHLFAAISAEEGSIMPAEARMVSNALKLDQVRTVEIMTPRSVVSNLPGHLTLREAHAQFTDWRFSRIPVFARDETETWVGYVLSKRVLASLANGEFDRKIESLCEPLYFVSESTPGHVLLNAFLRKHAHLFGVIDQHGDVSGIVTLEDVLESLIGAEIVDESDVAVDMQSVARMRARESSARPADGNH